MVGIDPALLMFAGRFLTQGGGDPGNGFGNALGAGLEAAGQTQLFRQQQQRQNKQDMVADAENAIAMRKGLQELQMGQQAQQQAAAQQKAQQAYLKALPEGQRTAAAVNPREAALLSTKQANPKPLSPSDRFKVVGSDLYDVSGHTPTIAAQGGRSSEQLEEVFDPETGTSRYVPRSEAAGGIVPPKQGITIGPDGTVQIGGSSAGLSRKTKNTVEEQLLDIDNKRQRLQQIASTWKPEYNQIGSRLGLAWEGIKDKAQFLGAPDKQAIQEFSQFKQNALSNINHTIKEITGAAMSNAEAQRIRLTEADAGTGIFDGDGPTGFKAKLDNAQYTVNLARARMAYLLQNGIDYETEGGNAFNGVSLDQMPELIDMRGAALEQQYIQNGMDPVEAEQLVASELRTEFGL